MVVSSNSSSFSRFGNSFFMFSLGGEGFSSTHLEMTNRDPTKVGFSALGFRTSLDRKRVRAMAMMYHIQPEIEIVIPRKHDSVMYPPVGLSAIYLDHLKVRFCISLFPLLINILSHYQIGLTQPLTW